MSFGFASTLTKPQTPLSAALDLVFAGATLATFDPRITAVRNDGASVATFYGSDGLLKVQGYNLLTYSQDFSNAAWATKTSITLTSGVSDPFGGNNAFTLQNDVLNNGVLQQVVTGSSATAYTGSIWVRRRVGTGQVSIRVAELAASPITITSTWTRVSYTNTSTTTTIRLGLFFSGGAVGDQIDIYGAQLEAGSTASQYSPTTTAANSAPRLDYDPATLLPRGLLVEEQRANLLLQSADFGTTWSLATGLKAFGSGSTLNATTAPDGTVSADLITEDATTGLHRVIQGGLTTTAQAYTLSCFVKPNGRQIVGLRLSDGVTTFGVGLNTSTLASVAITGDTAPTTQSIVSVGGGWYRVSMTATTAAAAGTAIATVCGVSGAAISYTGDNASGYYLWGAQLEAGSFPTSYIPTTTASATRSADSVSMTGTNLTSWFGGTSGTVVAEFDATYASTSGAILSFDQSTTNTLGLWASSATSIIGEATGATNISVSVAAVSNVNKAAYAFAPSDRAVSVNGGTVSTQANGGIPASVDTFRMGVNRSGSSRLNGHIRRIQYYPTRLPNASLQALTA